MKKIKKTKSVKVGKKTTSSSIPSVEPSELRLPLDLLLVKDVEDLEDALSASWAIEHESEIYFFKSATDVKVYKDELDDDSAIKCYSVDAIENDRIQAVIDLLNMAEENSILSHLIDRIVR